jgi:hypothetical protein
MNDEERALWNRIVVDYLNSQHSQDVANVILQDSTLGSKEDRASIAIRIAATIAACKADAALDERRKRFTAVPVDDWKHAKFAVTVGTCCYCESWPVRVYQRGNVFFGCEKCTGLAPQSNP